MINCSITQAQQVKLAALLLKDLEQVAAKNTPYNVEDSIRSIFDLVSSSQKNREMALDYARLVPGIIATVGTWNNTTRKMVAKDAVKIAELAEKFEEDIKNVETFFGTKGSDIQDAKDLQAALQREKFDSTKHTAKIPDSTVKNIENIPFIEATQEKYHPEEYRLESGIRDRIIEAKPEEGKLINLPEIGKVKLVAMSASNIPDSQRKPNELAYLQKLKESNDVDNGVYLVLVDENNEFVYVDDEFRRAGENTGKVVYYNLYNTTKRGEKKKATTEENPYIKLRLAYYKSIQVGTDVEKAEKAQAALQRELDNIDAIREYIALDPKNNKVEFHTTGGSFKTQTGVERSNTPLAKLGAGVQIVDVSGVQVQFGVEGVKPAKGKNLVAERGYYSPELADKIVAVLFDNVTYNGQPIDNKTRIRLAGQFVNFSTQADKGLDVDYRGEQLKFKIHDRTVTGTAEEQRQAVYNYLTATIPAEKITEAQAAGKKQHVYQKMTNAEFAAKVASGEIKPGHVLVKLDESGNPVSYRKVDQTKINMKKALLATNSYEDFDVVGGNIVSKHNQPYTDFVINNSTITYSTDNTGKLTTTPGYLNITPVAKSFAVATETAEQKAVETVEVPVDKNPITGGDTNAASEFYVYKNEIRDRESQGTIEEFETEEEAKAAFAKNYTNTSNTTNSDIEKRRQEELKFYEDSSAQEIRDALAANKFPTAFRKLYFSYKNGFKIKGKTYNKTDDYQQVITDENGVKIGSLLKGEFVSDRGTLTEEEFAELLKGIDDFKPVEILKKINAKYDAELAALNKQPETTAELSEEEQLALLEQEELAIAKQQFNAQKNDDGSNKNKVIDVKEASPSAPKINIQEKIKEILDNANFIVLTADERNYVNTKTGKEYKRVTSLISPEEIDKENKLVQSSLAIGTKVDTLVRDYFAGELKNLSDYNLSDEETVRNFLAQLKEIKDNLERRGEIVVPNNVVLYNDAIGVAGTVDLLTYDAKGVVRIYDVKTMRGNNFAEFYRNDPNNKYESTQYGKSKKQKHNEQLSLYRILLNNTHGIEAATLGVIPVEIQYKAGDDSTTVLNLLPRVKVEPTDKVAHAELNAPAVFNKLSTQSGKNATSAQNIAAKEWFEKTFKGKVSFKDLTHLANMSNPRSIATWQTSGVTLYHGAEFSDLYHEAWHAFSQTFLNKADKVRLYREAAKKQGSFKDYNGKKVEFSKATELQLEEFLAEDFRAYMLNGGQVAKDSPVRNTLFRRIVKFLKAMFGNTTLAQLTADKNANESIKGFYDQLRKGDLNQYSFATENRNFDTLHKGLEAYKADEPIKSLSITDSKLVVDTIDSLFSLYADAQNAGLTGSQFIKRNALVYELVSLPEIGLTEAQAARKAEIEAEVKTLIGNQTYKNSTELFETRDGLQFLYKNALVGLKRQAISIGNQLRQEQAKENPMPATIANLQSGLNAVNYAINNFGDVDNFSNNKTGVIAYHMQQSSFIKLETMADIMEEELSGRVDEEGKNVFDRGGQDNSLSELADRDTEILIKSLHKTNRDGSKATNRLGVPELEDYKTALRRIAGFCENLSTIQAMKASMEKNVDVYPVLQQLLDKLGPIKYEGQTAREEDQWTKFWQTMNKYRISLQQVTIDKETPLDEQGNVIGQSTFTVKIGEIGAEIKDIKAEWENQFALGVGNTLLINSDRGNSLDLNRIYELYPTKESIEGKEFEYLTALGVGLKDDAQVRKELSAAIKSGDIKLDAFPDKIKKMLEAGYSVKSIGVLMGANKTLGIDSEAGNYNKLAKLQMKYSGERSDHMTKNAEGKAQSEYSLNNSITQKIKMLNEVKSFDELVGVGMEGRTAMSYLAQYYNGQLQNPFLDSSVFMNAIFDMSKPGGPKRPNANLVLENLSGIAFLDNGKETDNRSETFSSDAVSKMVQEFHLQLLTGNPELPRHADKTTSYSVYVSDLGLGNKQKNLFVDTYQFLVGGIGTAKSAAIMSKYVVSELNRIRESRRLLAEADDTMQTDFNYLKRGSEFVYFANILSDSTKAKLLAIADDNVQTFLETEGGKSLANEVTADIEKYLETQTKLVADKFNESPYISEQLYTRVREHAASLGQNNVTDAELQAAMIKSFVANNWMHKYETSNLLYGDLALYEDYNKRIASAASTGDLMRSDADWIQSVNDRLGKPYAKSLGVIPAAYDGFIKTAVTGKVEIPSAYRAIYGEALGEVKASKYGKVEEADASAFITFDMYRIVSKSISQWSTDQERVFNKIVAKDRLDAADKEVTFPVLKMSYFGPLYGEGLSLHALHKFALFPLVPTVIKGTNLEKIHDKMSKEDIGYMTFKSGSKVATVTTGKKIDAFYSNVENNEISEKPFTQNIIHSDFLKMQIKPSTKVKKQISFFTQMRLMIDSGLIDNGVPVDYQGTEEAWKELSHEGKKAESTFYAKRTAFRDSVYELSAVKRAELLKEIGGVVGADGQLQVDMTKLLELVNRELSTRREMAEHELEFIQMKDGKLKHDLSLSPSAEQVEKVLTAVLNKRLINYKVNGNELVMVAATGFEKQGHIRKFTAPTEKDLAEHGSNDLPTYMPGEGKTNAAKCKLPMQNDFRKLLSLSDVSTRSIEKGISRLAALNELIKEEEWLNTGDNRKMISLVGARRPTQGLNSMEFVEVYEFLPEEAGSIIIMPTEITAKMGADFDYDKLPMMIPHLKVVGDKVVLYKEFTPEEVKELHDSLIDSEFKKLLEKDFDRDDLRKFFSNPEKWGLENTMQKFFGEDYFDDLKQIVLEDGLVDSLEDFTNVLNNPTKIAENKIQQSARELLELPANFNNLITPNDTDLVTPTATALKELTEKRSKEESTGPTKNMEILHNLAVQQTNSVAKDSLGIGAVHNKFNPVLAMAGAYLPAEYTLNPLAEEPYYFLNKILMPANRVQKDGQEVISLGKLTAQDGNSISDVMSQLLNGWLDAAKDDFIFYLRGNKELTPILTFLVQAGVPIEHAAYFISQPLVQEYVESIKQRRGALAPVFGKQSKKFKEKADALKDVLGNPVNGFKGTVFPGMKAAELDSQARQLINTVVGEEGFKLEDLKKTLEGYKKATSLGNVYQPTELDRAAFLHFIQIEGMEEALTKVKRSMNFDTDTKQTFSEMDKKESDYAKMSDSYRMSPEVVSKLNSDSPLGAYRIQDIAQTFQEKLFILFSNPVVKEFMDEQVRAGDSFKDVEEAKKMFKQDLVSYIFQNEIRKFDKTTDRYKDLKLDDEKIAKDFPTRASEDALAPLNPNAIKTEKEFAHYIYEREALRGLYPITSIQGEMDFKTLLATEEKNPNNKKLVPDYAVDNNLVNKDGSKRLASTNGEKITIRTDTTLDEFFEYLGGVDSETSNQKVKVLENLEKKGYSLEKIKSILNTKKKMLTFLVLHEQSHIDNKDKDVYWAQGKDLTTPDKIEIEARASVDALLAVENNSNIAQQVAYEKFLRNRALNNIFNPWQLFKSHTSVADRFLSIKKAYPELGAQYPLVRNLVFDDSGELGYRNLRLSTTKLKKIELEVFHENLVELSAKFVGNTTQDTEYVRDFFSKFGLYAMMQSGIGNRGKYAMGRIAPYGTFLELMKAPVAKFDKEVTPQMLMDFYSTFDGQNSSYAARVRSKDYIAAEKPVTTQEGQTTLFPEVGNPLRQAGVKPSDMSGNAAKDIAMANVATQFIGEKSGNASVSSTDKYKAAWGAQANTGVYTKEDVVMVSGSGPWRGVTMEQIKNKFTTFYKPLLDSAINAQAKFVVGNAQGADQLVRDYLLANGYNETKADGYSYYAKAPAPLSDQEVRDKSKDC